MRLKSAMDRSCASVVDTGCYQAVMDVLEDTNRLLESRSLNKRVLDPISLICGLREIYSDTIGTLYIS